ncbi:MAG: hypothetical protein NXH91_18845 [Phyllobacteriaceae bacterium]|jgi:hypothetical protein|nr:hypothetical protein [Phyllobacteriaceae bacterium]
MLADPPRDGDGEVCPHNHSEILDPDLLVRGVKREHHMVLDDDGARLSSAILTPSSKSRDKYEGWSADIKKLMEADSCDPENRYLRERQFDGAVELDAGALRAEEALVGYAPLSDNPYHGSAWGQLRRPSGRKNRLLKRIRWLLPVK